MQQEAEKTFFEYSKEIAQNFLQTVVAIDDNMNFDQRPSVSVSVSVDDDVELFEPDNDSGLGSSINTTKNNKEPAGAIGHEFYYQMLSSAFAKKSIVCSGFKPLSNKEESIKAIVKTSKNADITILDWQMDGTEKDGSLATSAIIKLAKNDIDEGGRLRLIAVYTGEEIEKIISKLVISLTELFEPIQSNTTITFKDKKLNHWKIDVISKDTNEEELTIKLIDSFACLTSGLLSNAALSMIADIRDKTHNILHKFNKTLDPAYLSHVLGLISSPDTREQAHEVAFDYAVDLLSEELKSELQTSLKVKDSLSKEAMQCWPTYANSTNNMHYFRLKIGTEDPIMIDTEKMNTLLSELDSDQLTELLEKTLGIQPKDNVSPIDRFKKESIQLTVLNNETTSLFELCAIESSRRDITTVGTHSPVLKQGTILKKSDDNVYFMCIQPLCDSVRLKSSSSFSLLKISKSSKDFTHIIRNAGGHLKLKITPTPKDIRTYFFEPDEGKGTVRATNKTKSFVFHGKNEGSNDEIVFEWCGEFKQTVSQSIINGLAAQLSRIGFDTFEWLRLKRPN